MESGNFNPTTSLPKNGIKSLNSVYYNLNESALLEHAILRREGTLGLGGALLVKTGKHTGRSPNDKFVVITKSNSDSIWWKKNAQLSAKNFDLLYCDMLDHMKGNDYFVQDLYACADPELRLNVRLINEFAWHGLFIRHLLRRPRAEELPSYIPDFTVINCPTFKVCPARYKVRSDTVIAINFEKRQVLIGGTAYAGENKKVVFTLLNYLLPSKGVMPMHCSANHSIGDEEDVAVFFGLSGTGKTTLSQDEGRVLIGDDEHGWSDRGIFNFEGGCYAKTLNLSAEAEPEIHSTMSKFATVIENMNFHPDTLELDYEDDSLTPNMRSAYPLESISNVSKSSLGGPPKNIILLTCDAFGVLPPIAKLSPEQAIYHFLLGFTSKAPGTERGVIEPEPTFSACFAAPFLPLRPEIYGSLLKKKIDEASSKCWLVNTGWTGGAFGVGNRIRIKDTRRILTAILDSTLSNAEFRVDSNFGFKVPTEIKDIDKRLLNPRETWPTVSAYDKQARKLVELFAKNFENFVEVVDESILNVAI